MAKLIDKKQVVTKYTLELSNKELLTVVRSLGVQTTPYFVEHVQTDRTLTDGESYDFYCELKDILE